MNEEFITIVFESGMTQLRIKNMLERIVDTGAGGKLLNGADIESDIEKKIIILRREKLAKIIAASLIAAHNHERTANEIMAFIAQSGLVSFPELEVGY